MRIEGLILAAGFSSRAPGYKMTLPLGGEKVLDKTIQSMMPYCQRIVVVAGYRAEEILPICNRYTQVEMIVNENYRDGMFSSIKCGMAILNCDRFFLLPGDMPYIRMQTYEALLKEDGDVVIPSFQYHGGHPILMEGSCIEPCLKSPGIETLRDFIHRREIKYIHVEDPGILMDIDTPEDYQKMIGCWNSENTR